MNTAWNIATIAYQPYPDVGEFVNVGVLGVAIPDRILAYRLLPAQATARVHGFFPELDLAIYKEGRRRMEEELQRLESTINSTLTHTGQPGRLTAYQPPLPGADAEAASLFRALTAPRGGQFRIHAKGTRLADSPDALLTALFDRYIVRNTAGQEDPEELRLVNEVGRLLEEWKLRRLYKKDVRVGTDAFHVRFPFAYQPDEEPTPLRVIKPLNLSRANSTQIYHHGDLWIANFARLRRLSALPGQVLLPVQMPLLTRGASRECMAAAEEIRAQFDGMSILTAESSDWNALRAFAEIPQEAMLVLKA